MAKSATRAAFTNGGAEARGIAGITSSCFIFFLLSVSLEELEDAERVASSDSSASSGSFLLRTLSFFGAAAAADDESPVSPNGSRSG